jgi:NitT/TauT family transport system substrate-binding protein
MLSVWIKTARIGAVVLGAFAAFACTTGAAVADDALHVLGGSYPPSINGVDEIVADAMGYFKAEHLAVDKQFAGNNSVCDQEVAIGKADICVGNVETLIAGYAKGLHMQFFLNRDPRYDYTLAVLADSPIKTVADFKGATLGETNVGNGSEISSNATLAGAGLRPGDYGYTPVGLAPEALAALSTHKVDGLSYPTQELETMHAVGHVDFRTFPNGRLTDVPNMGFAASPATIAAKADQLARFSRAMVKAFIFVRVNPQAAARFYLQGTNQRVTPALLATMTSVIEAMQPDFPAYDLANKRIGYMSVRAISLYCQFFADAGKTPDVVPGTDLVTNRFIAFANRFDHRAVIEAALKMR